MKQTIHILLSLLSCSLLSHGEITQECLNGAIQVPLKPTDNYQIDHNNNEVIDNKHGLIWSRCLYGTKGDTCSEGLPQSIDWDKAFDEPQRLMMLGEQGWRIPNIIELGSLVDSSCHNPAINVIAFDSVSKYLNDYTPHYLWSSTSDYSNPERVYVLNLLTGAIEVKFKEIQKNITNGVNVGMFYTLLVKSK